jgi:phosphoenolpyruvate-protein phosphotransferase (PTS system enzyme I)
MAISPGIVVAPAYRVETVSPLAPSTAGPFEVADELSRFEAACHKAAADLTDLIERVSSEIGAEESRIFQSHLFMVRDRAFIQKVTGLIAEHHISAEDAVNRTQAEYEQIFSAIDDDYLRERWDDLLDVVERLRQHLVESAPVESVRSDQSVVLVAREILPSQTLRLGERHIVGVVTERGSRTSHAAIIARSLGLPVVGGIPDIFNAVRNGDMIAVDGRDGIVIVNPGPEAESAYRKLEREFVDLKDKLIHNRHEPSVTSNGVAIELAANINNVADAKAAADVGATAIGLFRTEYLFMMHPSIPTEDEQTASYRAIVDAAPKGHVTIRTLDLGGDKILPYFPIEKESNPFLGFRSIRRALAHPEFFKHQVRAILRAGIEGRVRILLPMISTVEEIEIAREFIAQAKDELAREGLPFSSDVPLGIMVEVPSAAVAIDTLLDAVDFVSIGTNDLVQYLMAADRDNPNVAYLCDPLSPAVLRVLYQVIQACRKYEVDVAVCGEMAGRPRSAVALLAFGLRSLSMGPAFVPLIKELVHSLSTNRLIGLVDEILSQKKALGIHQILNSVLSEIDASIARLDAGPADASSI